MVALDGMGACPSQVSGSMVQPERSTSIREEASSSSNQLLSPSSLQLTASPSPSIPVYYSSPKLLYHSFRSWHPPVQTLLPDPFSNHPPASPRPAQLHQPTHPHHHLPPRPNHPAFSSPNASLPPSTRMAPATTTAAPSPSPRIPALSRPDGVARTTRKAPPSGSLD